MEYTTTVKKCYAENGDGNVVEIEPKKSRKYIILKTTLNICLLLTLLLFMVQPEQNYFLYIFIALIITVITLHYFTKKELLKNNPILHYIIKVPTKKTYVKDDQITITINTQ